MFCLPPHPSARYMYKMCTSVGLGDGGPDTGIRLFWRELEAWRHGVLEGLGYVKKAFPRVVVRFSSNYLWSLTPSGTFTTTLSRAAVMQT